MEAYNTTMQGNTAGETGGAISTSGASALLTNSTFTNNVAM